MKTVKCKTWICVFSWTNNLKLSLNVPMTLFRNFLYTISFNSFFSSSVQFNWTGLFWHGKPLHCQSKYENRISLNMFKLLYGQIWWISEINEIKTINPNAPFLKLFVLWKAGILEIPGFQRTLCCMYTKCSLEEIQLTTIHPPTPSDSWFTKYFYIIYF